MTTYSNFFDYIDLNDLGESTNMDTEMEAPTSMIFTYEDTMMEKQASLFESSFFRNLFSVEDKEIWKIDGSNIVRISDEIIEG
jgi:hypothetical protein